MKKLIFVSLATFLAVALFLAGPVSAQMEILEGMAEPIPDEAIKALLTKYPDDTQMHLGAAFLFTEDENKAEAKEKAIKLAPEYKKIFLIQDLKGVTYKKYDKEALKKLEELVKIDPGNAWPHYLLAAHYLNKGEKERWVREVDDALVMPRFDDYEMEQLRAIFRVLDEINPSLKAVNKLNHLYGVILPLLVPARDSARELVKIGKELEEKGEKAKALEYYRKAERIGQQFLLRKLELGITKLVSIAIRKIAYEEMTRFYEEEGRKTEAAVLREQIDLMDAWRKALGEIMRKYDRIVSKPIWGARVSSPVWNARLRSFDIDWEEIKPEERKEIKAKLDHFKKNAKEIITSPDYVKMVDEYVEKFLSEGAIEAYKSLPEPKKSPIAQYLERAEKERRDLSRAIDQSLLPRAESSKICRSNLKRIGLACEMFALDHKDVFPPNLAVLGKAGYIEERYFPKWMKCPASGEEYVYIGAGKSTRKVKNPSRTIIAYDKKPVHDNGRNVVFMDGHCEWMPEEEFQKRLAEQKGK